MSRGSNACLSLHGTFLFVAVASLIVMIATSAVGGEMAAGEVVDNWRAMQDAAEAKEAQVLATGETLCQPKLPATCRIRSEQRCVDAPDSRRVCSGSCMPEHSRFLLFAAAHSHGPVAALRTQVAQCNRLLQES